MPSRRCWETPENCWGAASPPNSLFVAEDAARPLPGSRRCRRRSFRRMSYCDCEPARPNRTFLVNASPVLGIRGISRCLSQLRRHTISRKERQLKEAKEAQRPPTEQERVSEQHESRNPHTDEHHLGLRRVADGVRGQQQQRQEYLIYPYPADSTVGADQRHPRPSKSNPAVEIERKPCSPLN